MNKAPTNLKGLCILQVIPALNLGGAERTTMEIAQAIMDAGGRAIVVSAGGAMADAIRATGAMLIIMPVASKNPFVIFANARRLRRIAEEHKVDIIHARSRAPAWSAYFAARQSQMIYLATYHAKVHMRPALKRFYNSVLVRGRVVIANSHFTAAQIMRAHKVPPTRIRAIARGCDVAALARENVNAARVAALRQQWGVGADDFVILCPARLTRWKGQHVLIEALAQYQNQYQSSVKLKLVLLGGGEKDNSYSAMLKVLAAKLSPAAQNPAAENDTENCEVIFADSTNDMASAYAAAQCVAAPSIAPEPFGRIIIEAQAACVPVLASDDGGFRETVQHGISGWLVPTANVAAWAQAIDNVVGLSPAARAQMGQAGCALVRAQFSDVLMRERTLAVYRELCPR